MMKGGAQPPGCHRAADGKGGRFGYYSPKKTSVNKKENTDE